ncbi:tetrapyrrole (Corrin/Porphyrin) Methylases family protein [Xanthomonas citri pv. mangiferaeindicae LMG 941]|nr:tetrapyrrole (Corrin/Porphyrin) Methylases family protein [Xanthomonas citri pv. mangiferaeindicae LMG 941]
MRRYALQGRRVVRVKGDDALLFGHAGEEIAFLRRAGVGVQVIDGVSAAFAAVAALDVSLTHRSHCHGITFVTAHTHDHGEPNWGALAASGTTLGIYMGLRRADALAAALLARLPASTPAAIVQAATRPEQQRRLTALVRPRDDSRRAATGSADLVAGGRCFVRSCCSVRRPRWADGGAGSGVGTAHHR